MTESYVYDTYALLEILNNNKNYAFYLDKNPIINDFIFAEFCYKLIRERVSNAEDKLNEVIPALVDVEPEIIKEAMKFRSEHKINNLSMTDCISYIMAKNLGIKFLTGDKEFENLENVEFVK